MALITSTLLCNYHSRTFPSISRTFHLAKLNSVPIKVVVIFVVFCPLGSHRTLSPSVSQAGMLLPYSRQGNWSLRPDPSCLPEPGGGLCWATWECLRNPVTSVFLLQVPCCRGRRCGDSRGLLLWTGNTILAWVSTGFQSGERVRPLPSSFPSTPSNGRAEMGEDSFRLAQGKS